MPHLERLRSRFLAFIIICFIPFAMCGCEVGSSFYYEYDERSTEQAGDEFKISKSDENTAANEIAVEIDLSEEDSLRIDTPGDYILHGSMRGSILVHTDDGNVQLLFDGVDILSQNGPAVFVKSAGKVIITLVEDSENVIGDSANYEDYEDYRACIFSNEDLTINGSGTLEVFSYVADGIRSKDVLKILGGEISVLAKKNGLRGNDGVYLSPDVLTLECEGYGIVTDVNTRGECGNVYICGGKISLTTGKNPVTSRGDLNIGDADVEIYSVLPDFDVAGKVNVERGAVK